MSYLGSYVSIRRSEPVTELGRAVEYLLSSACEKVLLQGSLIQSISAPVDAGSSAQSVYVPVPAVQPVEVSYGFTFLDGGTACTVPDLNGSCIIGNGTILKFWFAMSKFIGATRGQ